MRWLTAMMLLRHAAALQRCTPSLRSIKRGQLQMSTTKKSVTIKRGKARLFRDGNPLVYGGAVERTTGSINRGDAVEVVDGAGNPIGWGFYNPDSMYRVRLLPGPMADDAMVAVRSLIETACERRSALNLPSEATSAFRLINSEGDGLSGLTVDAYGAHLVCSISAAWAEARRMEITAALEESYSTLINEKPQIIWRPAVARLKSEGLEMEADDDAGRDAVEATESNLIYEVDVWGQKTGFYCDQRDNRNFLAPLCTGKTVLDLYCYSGGFALSAAKHGASSCIGVDSSRRAVELAQRNAARNALDGICRFEASDVSAFLNNNSEQYDVVVCDPPKLAPSIRDLPRAKRKYQKINALALQAVKPGGLLLTCSCSSAMTTSEGAFLAMLREAARDANKRLTVLRTAGAAADHVLHPAFPEGAYLTAALVQVVDR
jgi:23S rRNA G2069 N7-methylase RlmK/C1962 C5-methylase RlmI